MEEQGQAVVQVLQDWLKQSMDSPKEDVYTEILGYRFKNLKLKPQESIIEPEDDDEEFVMDFNFEYEDVIKL